MICRDDEVTGQCDAESAGDDVPFGCADRRLPEMREELEEPWEAIESGDLFRQRARVDEILEIPSGGEYLRVRGPQDEHSYLIVITRTLECGEEFIESVITEGIACAWIIEPDGRRGTVGLVPDRARTLCHQSLPSLVVGWCVSPSVHECGRGRESQESNSRVILPKPCPLSSRSWARTTSSSPKLESMIGAV